MVHVPFENRLEAGRLLAEELSERKISPGGIVIGLTRGGVPTGFPISARLRLALDVIVVRKIGVPWQPELAMGAMAGSVRIIDHALIRHVGIYAEDVEETATKEQAAIKRREELYRAGRPALELNGRSVIIVDDGLATGNTMLAAIRYVRSLHPANVTVAVPVGAKQACDRIREEVDEFVCLAIPEDFHAVGQWYEEFRAVSDSEVQALLRKSLASPTAA
jgi:putative phosphoribosyl transferase